MGTVINQPQFKSVLGEFKLCEKMAQFDAKKFADFQGKGGKGLTRRPRRSRKRNKRRNRRNQRPRSLRRRTICPRRSHPRTHSPPCQRAHLSWMTGKSVTQTAIPLK